MHRRRWGITQSELAYMLGLRGGNGSISRVEEDNVEPTLPVLFGLLVVFGKAAHEFFPARFAEIEEQVLTRAYNLYEELQGKRSRLTKIKLDFLEEMFERGKRRRNSNALC